MNDGGALTEFSIVKHDIVLFFILAVLVRALFPAIKPRKNLMGLVVLLLIVEAALGLRAQIIVNVYLLVFGHFLHQA